MGDDTPDAQVAAARALLRNAPGRHVVFATTLMRARELRIAQALRRADFTVVAVYLQTTPFHPGDAFDASIRAENEAQAHEIITALEPEIVHAFTGAIDPLIIRLIEAKPCPVVVDLNDIFSDVLFNYEQDRYEPTKYVLAGADGLCARDLQARAIERAGACSLPPEVVFVPEACWTPSVPPADPARNNPGEVHVVSVGTFCLERQRHYDSAYLYMAKQLLAQKIHFHIYPHWFYRKAEGSVFNQDFRRHFRDFIWLNRRSRYLHLHESLSLEELERVLPQYDFGIVSGGSEAFRQSLTLTKRAYMNNCYSGRITDYLTAGLPVLINKEVRFGYRFLKRHGAAVDLDGLLSGGFRDRLLAIKNEGEMHARARALAQHHHVDRFAMRLAAFYGRVAKKTPVRAGAPPQVIPATPPSSYIRFKMRVKEKMPFLTPVYRTLRMLTEGGRSAEEAQRLHAELQSARASLESLKIQDERRIAELEDALRAEREVRRATEKSYEDANTRYWRLRMERSLGGKSLDELNGLIHWEDIGDDVLRTNGMLSLVRALDLMGRGSNDPLSRPSECWRVIGTKHLEDLLRFGFDRFKQRLGGEYFTFIHKTDGEGHDLLRRALDDPAAEARAGRRAAASEAAPFDGLSAAESEVYRLYVFLLYEVAAASDALNLLDRLSEPEIGAPYTVQVEGRAVSQDILNSCIEVNALAETISLNGLNRFLEVGGGYGRTTYALLHAAPDAKAVLVDLPPALWVAQRYLSLCFPEKKVFPIQGFDSFESVEEQMREADLIFLLPHQIRMAPDRFVDLAFNISSFSEMDRLQVTEYLSEFERLSASSLYIKQWEKMQNAFSDDDILWDDFVFSEKWEVLFDRPLTVVQGFREKGLRRR